MEEPILLDINHEHDQEAHNAVTNGLNWGKEDGVEVQVIVYAMKYLQANPGVSIPDAIDFGVGEWVK